MLKRTIEWGRSTGIIDSDAYTTSCVYDATTLSAGGSGGTNEVQTVTVSGTPTGGNLTLSFRGQVTGNIAFNAIADVVETALEALSTVGVGNVRVTGGPGPGTPWVITFVGDLGHADQPLLVKNAAGLTGGTSPDVAVAQTTAGSSTGFDPRIMVGSFDKPITMVLKLTNPRGDGQDKIAEYKGTGSIYGFVDGQEEFMDVVPGADRSMPVYGLGGFCVVDARKIKNYSANKSAIDTWAAAHGVSVRHG